MIQLIALIIFIGAALGFTGIVLRKNILLIPGVVILLACIAYLWKIVVL